VAEVKLVRASAILYTCKVIDAKREQISTDVDIS
jgi:hypothetical protein